MVHSIRHSSTFHRQREDRSTAVVKIGLPFNPPCVDQMVYQTIQRASIDMSLLSLCRSSGTNQIPHNFS